ncbi:hypothetical protein SPAR10_0158 [Streptococcus infantis SPAR10]|uniref:Uncharacterized protein n=1 Tax=Streptococcus infantis SPAR10 TaxID=1159208 RepID=J0YPA1_9STRE|nr:hypothetical protein SPAR10_0158 [Streptococcus infantis SPAR10]
MKNLFLERIFERMGHNSPLWEESVKVSIAVLKMEGKVKKEKS